MAWVPEERVLLFLEIKGKKKGCTRVIRVEGDLRR